MGTGMGGSLSLTIKFGVFANVFLELLGDFDVQENRLNRTGPACMLASDANLGIDKVLIGIIGGGDAIYRTHLQAGGVLNPTQGSVIT